MTKIAELKELFQGLEIVDLAPTLYSNMPGWPTHPQFSIIGDARNFGQHGYFAQTLVMSEHNGCHVDAPPHLHEHLMDKTIDTFPPDALVGPGKKIDASAEGLEPGETLSLDRFKELLSANEISVEEGDVVLVEFGWDRHLDEAEEQSPEQHNWWGSNEPGFSEDLCEYIAESRVKAVGTDTAACDIAEVDGEVQSAPGHATHFLPNDILIVEGLYGLNRLPAEFFFVGLPLRLKGGSGSPLRPIALVSS